MVCNIFALSSGRGACALSSGRGACAADWRILIQKLGKKILTYLFEFKFFAFIVLF